MQQRSAEALLSALTQSSNELTQGWMRVMASAPSLPSFDSSLQQRYFEQQALLWTALASGKRETLIRPEPGDRRFASKEWQDNPYYDYLKQSYLLAARFLEQMIDSAQLEQQAKERTRFAARQ